MSRAPKEEQQDATDEVIEVAPGILRLQLPIQFTGLGHVNTYALEDARGWALVDPGLPGRESWDALGGRMALAGIPLRHVHTVVVTHSHPDHFGGAGLLAERSGATIVAAERFRTWWDPAERDGELDDAREDGTTAGPSGDDPPALPPSPFGRPTPWGGRTEDLPPERRAALEADRAEALRWFRVPRPGRRLADQQAIELAGREWFALDTPGHTNDHLCLWDPGEGVLLSGDHVLPTITPHISGMIEGDPLARYVLSLQRVAALPGVTTVLPAHGQPFTDLPGRVAAIERHHDERLGQLRRISDELGWATVQALSRRLFAERSWGSMAESETYAHLEHLRRRGDAERREVGGLLEFLIP